MLNLCSSLPNRLTVIANSALTFYSNVKILCRRKKVEEMGFEPTTPALQSVLSQLSFPPQQVTHLKMGGQGLEPPTSRLSGVRSNQLSYRPMIMRPRILSKVA